MWPQNQGRSYVQPQAQAVPAQQPQAAAAYTPPALSPLAEADPQAIEELWNRLDPLAVDWRSPEVAEIVTRLRAWREQAAVNAAAGKARSARRAAGGAPQQLSADDIASIEW